MWGSSGPWSILISWSWINVSHTHSSISCLSSLSLIKHLPVERDTVPINSPPALCFNDLSSYQSQVKSSLSHINAHIHSLTHTNVVLLHSILTFLHTCTTSPSSIQGKSVLYYKHEKFIFITEQKKKIFKY